MSTKIIHVGNLSLDFWVINPHRYENTGQRLGFWSDSLSSHHEVELDLSFIHYTTAIQFRRPRYRLQSF